MLYRIDFLPVAQKELASLPDRIQRQIREKINALATNPRPPECAKLKGPRNSYRIRSGDYRIIYQVRDKVLMILIVRVAHRREVYRKLD